VQKLVFGSHGLYELIQVGISADIHFGRCECICRFSDPYVQLDSDINDQPEHLPDPSLLLAPFHSREPDLANPKLCGELPLGLPAATEGIGNQAAQVLRNPYYMFLFIPKT
jgi:hypothetical protein